MAADYRKSIGKHLRQVAALLSAHPPTLIRTEETQVDAAWLVDYIAAHLEAPPREYLLLEEDPSDLI
jgi:hypothetical protein